VLGVVAQSGLMRAVTASSIGCLVLLAAFTLGPYAWDKWFAGPPHAAAVAPKRTTQSSATNTGAAGSAPAKVAADASTSTTDATGAAASQDLLDKLGEGEAKKSDPGLNPLEESADDLLKDLK
jgi:hypothetical protein